MFSSPLGRRCESLLVQLPSFCGWGQRDDRDICVLRSILRVMLITFRVDELEDQIRLKKAEIRISFHDVLDATLSAIKQMTIEIIRLQAV